MPTDVAPLDLAAGHLMTAADLIDGPTALPDLYGLSGLTRLTAGRVSPTPATPDPTVPARSFIEDVRAALEVLDAMDPNDGPADLALLAWHVHELHQIALNQGLL
ncbi:hypothetical protein [Leekyejoonella antrihumi]|uniref:Uncharacterized protein n=1 Tax=Leekyejoonella antrihumi TaxID=1660198 RepID=A0A563DUP4_9MICO|nr:hypothetical protein [Leekyejoonella antrihumi]TWP33978.1 hypothetical protein FGL98_19305 [Leekyejoonella antrihumi]